MMIALWGGKSRGRAVDEALEVAAGRWRQIEETSGHREKRVSAGRSNLAPAAACACSCMSGRCWTHPHTHTLTFSPSLFSLPPFLAFFVPPQKDKKDPQSQERNADADGYASVVCRWKFVWSR